MGTTDEYFKMISMKVKELLSLHIKDLNIRDSFITGDYQGDFIIENLDLGKITGYNFDDGNKYTFKECILENVDLHFKNDAIHFDSCTFAGNVSIHNQGIGEDDLVTLNSVKHSDKLVSLTLKSPEVDIINSIINLHQNMSITADTCVIQGCSLKANQMIDIYYLSDCTIRNSNIDRFTARTSPIINCEKDKPFLQVENSIINGQNISGFDFDANSTEKIPKIK